MHVITQKRIWEAKARWPQAATALDSWYRIMKASAPSDFAAMKRLFPAVDKVGAHHVFDIGGNKLLVGRRGSVSRAKGLYSSGDGPY
jgi:mRNA interferase HigB